MTSPLRIAIDARGARGQHGGIETIVQGLCFGLAGLDDGDEEYLLFTGSELVPLPRPYDHRVLSRTVMRGNDSLKGRVAQKAPWIRELYVRLEGALARRPPGVRRSNGILERGRADVVHFTRQQALLTDVPSIYQPHDLQHRHLPEFFDARTITERDEQYLAYARQAALVVVASSWVRDDVIAQLDLAPEGVRVVPWAAILPAYPPSTAAELEVLRSRFGLPEEFVLYPAQTWPHKNHAVLVRAVARLRTDGIDVPLVFPGRMTAHADVVAREAANLGVTDLVHFLGFVDDSDLRALYGLSRVVAVPSAFEASSLPLFEAFEAGVPSIASDATSLPAQVSDGALVVPVGDEVALAEALERLLTDEALREALTARAAVRGRDFSWTRTARLFRALYREIGGTLTDEDCDLLAEASPI